MKVEYGALMPAVRLGAAISKLPGGHDLIFFQGETVSLRSYSVGMDFEIAGLDLTAVVSAKGMFNAVKNMDTGSLELRLTKTQLVITDGVRNARLKLQESGDPIPLLILPEDMETVPPEFNLVLSRAIQDGHGNDGVQFLGDMTVSKGKSEVIISKVENLPSFYLQSTQINILQSAAISDLSVFDVSNDMVYFNDPGHCTIRCATAITPEAVTSDNMIKFQENVLEPAAELYAGIMDESIGTVLKRVLAFGTVDEQMGTAVRIIFDPELHVVKLIGENKEGAFEEVTAMEYDRSEPLDILISSTSLQELVGRPFVIKQRPDLDTGIWFVAVDGMSTYICGGTKKIVVNEELKTI